MANQQDEIRDLKEKLRMKDLVLEEIRKGHNEPSEKTLEKFDNFGLIVNSGFEEMRIKLATVATREYINDKFEKHENKERANMSLFLKKEAYEKDWKWMRGYVNGAYLFSGVFISVVGTLAGLLVCSYTNDVKEQLNTIHEEQKISKNDIVMLSQKLDNLEVTVYTND